MSRVFNMFYSMFCHVYLLWKKIYKISALAHWLCWASLGGKKQRRTFSSMVIKIYIFCFCLKRRLARSGKSCGVVVKWQAFQVRISARNLSNDLSGGLEDYCICSLLQTRKISAVSRPCLSNPIKQILYEAYDNVISPCCRWKHFSAAFLPQASPTKHVLQYMKHPSK